MGFFDQVSSTSPKPLSGDALYADGGVIGRNPSTIGGTWAYRLIDASGHVMVNSGVVYPIPRKLPKITNNYTELMAVLQGMLVLPDGWDGTIYTDSLVTINRITNSPKFVGTPRDTIELLRYQRRRLGVYRTVLLKGHPTKEEIKAGQREDGRPVSVHNQWCDAECGRLARMILDDKFIVTKAFIEDGISPRGGWTKQQLSILNVPWPPQPGWKRKAVGLIISRDDAKRFLLAENEQ